MVIVLTANGAGLVVSDVEKTGALAFAVRLN